MSAQDIERPEPGSDVPSFAGKLSSATTKLTRIETNGWFSRMVQAALGSFDRVDEIVNDAAIFLDGMIRSVTAENHQNHSVRLVEHKISQAPDI